MKALRCLSGHNEGRHGLEETWESLPLDSDFKARFRPLVARAGFFRPQVPYPDSEAYRVLTEEMPFEEWATYEREWGELTNLVIRVAEYEERGTRQPPEWCPPVRRGP